MDEENAKKFEGWESPSVDTPDEISVEKVEAETVKVREVQSSENADEIRAATDSLMSVVQEIGAAAYQQSEAAAEEPGEGEPEDEAEAGSDEEDGEDVVDGEFTDEDNQE